MQKSREFFLALLIIFAIGSEIVLAAAISQTKTGEIVTSVPQTGTQNPNLVTYTSKTGLFQITASPNRIVMEIPPQGGGSPLLNIPNERPIGPPPPHAWYGLQWREADVFQAGQTVDAEYIGDWPIYHFLTSAEVDTLRAKQNGTLVYPQNYAYTYPTGEFEPGWNYSEEMLEFIAMLNSSDTVRIRTFYFENIPPLDWSRFYYSNSSERQYLYSLLNPRLTYYGAPPLQSMYAFITYNPNLNQNEMPTKALVAVSQYYDENGTLIVLPNIDRGYAYVFGWRDSLTLQDDPSNYWDLYGSTGLMTSLHFIDPEESHYNYTGAGVQFGRMPSHDFYWPPDPTHPAFRGYELMNETSRYSR